MTAYFSPDGAYAIWSKDLDGQPRRHWLTFGASTNFRAVEETGIKSFIDARAQHSAGGLNAGKKPGYAYRNLIHSGS